MKKYNKKIISLLIFTLIAVEIISLFLTVKSFLNKNSSIDKINSDYTSSEMFAILLEQDNGEYIESTSSSWPSKFEYTYNAINSACMNSRGIKVDGALDFDENNSEVKIAVQEAVYCYLYFDKKEPLVGDAYALYTEDNQTLTFVRSETPITIGDTYNGKTVTYVCSNFETYIHEDGDDVCWYGEFPIKNIVFADEIRPISTRMWFYGAYLYLDDNSVLDFKKLNTSLVTDMTGMFLNASIVEGYSTNIALDLTGLNTSNVTSMKWMFRGLNLNIIGIETWDTSNVTDMSEMFYNSTLVNSIDLSNWDISKVENHSNFSYNIAGTGTFVEPNWQN